MPPTRPHSGPDYPARLARAAALLRKDAGAPAALVVSSAPPQRRSRDTFHPYRQSSDLFYLTGATAPGLTFLLTGDGAGALFAPPVDKARIVWDGTPESPLPAARRTEAELVVTAEPVREILRRLRKIDVLYHDRTPGTAAFAAAEAARDDHRGGLPRRAASAEVILETLRLHKDAWELGALRRAAAVTVGALRETREVLVPGAVERHVAAYFDYRLALSDARPSFRTIVASGPSAATLHYEDGGRRLRKGEPVLVDCGAEVGHYAGDVTRVFPVGGAFPPVHQEVYDVVLAAQLAAIARCRPGTPVPDVHAAAAEVLTRGLVSLGVLRGKTSALVAKKAYAPYFPHGVGHPLGLDVHDVGRPPRGEPLVLRPGMVYTIEPGLYFPKKTGRVPACGVRIEDDVAVTRGAPEVLTAEMPK